MQRKEENGRVKIRAVGRKEREGTAGSRDAGLRMAR